MRLKTVKVNNPKNVIVQIPIAVINKWGLNATDSLEVSIDECEKTVQIRPRKGYTQIRTGS